MILNSLAFLHEIDWHDPATNHFSCGNCYTFCGFAWCYTYGYSICNIIISLHLWWLNCQVLRCEPTFSVLLKIFHFNVDVFIRIYRKIQEFDKFALFLAHGSRVNKLLSKTFGFIVCVKFNSLISCCSLYLFFSNLNKTGLIILPSELRHLL